MVSGQVIKNYCQALFEIANTDADDMVVKQYFLQMEFLNKNFTSQYLHLLSNLKIPLVERKQLITKICGNNFFDDIKIFVFLLMEKGYINYFPAFCEEFTKLVHEHFKITTGTIYTIFPLEAAELNKISELLSKKLKKRIQLKNLIDKSILGGVVVVIEDIIINNSVLKSLQQVKADILQEGAQQ